MTIRRKLGVRIFGLSVALFSACQSIPPAESSAFDDHPPLVASDLGQMHNVSRSDAVWFGSLPAPSDLDLAHRRGIVAVIDLSLPEEAPGFDVASACESSRLEFMTLALESDESISDQAVDRVLAELRRPYKRPLLMFSGNGGRAAMFFAIYRAVDEGLALETAVIEARRAGMMPGFPEEFVRAQVCRLSESSRVAFNAREH